MEVLISDMLGMKEHVKHLTCPGLNKRNSAGSSPEQFALTSKDWLALWAQTES